MSTPKSPIEVLNVSPETQQPELTADTTDTTVGAQVKSAAPTKGGISPVGTTVLNPKQTAELLANMQQMIDQKTGVYHGIMSGIQDALAYASPRDQLPLALQYRNQQKQQEMQDVFGMREKMAALQASADQAKARLAGSQATLEQLRGGAGTSAGAGGAGYNPDILNRVEQLYNLGQWDAGDKLLNTHLEDVSKINRTAQVNPDYFKKSIEVVDPNNPNGTIFVSAADINNKGFQPTPRGRAQIQIQSEAPTQTGGDGDLFKSTVNNLIDKREGGFNPSDGKSGAPVNFGINQKYNPDVDVKNLTREQAIGIYKKRYWDPIGANNLNPDAAKVAFDASVNQGVDYAKNLIKQTNGDAQKMMTQRRADYSSGTQNPNWEARLNSLEKELSYAQPQAKRTDLNAPITSGMRAAQEAEATGSKEYASKVAASNAASATLLDDAYATSKDRLARNQHSLSLMEDKDIQNMVGYLEKSGTSAALLRQIRDGISLGRLGDVNLKDFDATLAKSKAPQSAIDGFNKLVNNLKKDEGEEARAMFKGQGQVSDSERKLVSAAVGSISNTADALRLAIKWREERAKFDNELGDAFNKYRGNNDYAPFGAFMRSEAARNIIDAHNARLSKTLGIDPQELAGNKGYDFGVGSGTQSGAQKANRKPLGDIFGATKQ